MIRIDVDLYCHDCSEFDPVTDQTVIHGASSNGSIIRGIDTVVTCKHKNRCRSIYEYMDKIREKNKLYNEVRKEGGEII